MLLCNMSPLNAVKGGKEVPQLSYFLKKEKKYGHLQPPKSQALVVLVVEEVMCLVR